MNCELTSNHNVVAAVEDALHGSISALALDDDQPIKVPDSPSKKKMLAFGALTMHEIQETRMKKHIRDPYGRSLLIIVATDCV